jgi:hypothetical protein
MFIVTRVLAKGMQKKLAVIAAAFLGLGFSSFALSANLAPNISGTPTTSVLVGSYYYFNAQASDPEGNRVSFAINNRPSWASFNTLTGELRGTPTRTGTWSDIKISAWDGRVSKSLPIFSIKVSSSTSGTTNRPPTISGTPATSASVGTAYSFTPNGSDPEGRALGYTIANRPSWASFSTSTGRLSGTPTATGTFSNIKISVSDGRTIVSLPVFAISVKSAGSTNPAPTISGSPARSVTAGTAYSFTPTASDANGNTLTFSIANKPAWATFSTSNGRLAGTPTGSSVGTYSNVTIRVSDGTSTASLAAFSIAVNAASSSVGAATLQWTPPTRNTDGSSLTNLSGYRIYYGTSSTSLTRTVTINSAGVSSYVISDLSPATYYFAVTAVNTGGVESSRSSLASKVIN